VGERGFGTVRCNGSGSRCPHPDPRHVPMTHDAIGSANDPGAWRGGGNTSQVDALLSASLWMSASTSRLRIGCDGSG